MKRIWKCGRGLRSGECRGRRDSTQRARRIRRERREEFGFLCELCETSVPSVLNDWLPKSLSELQSRTGQKNVRPPSSRRNGLKKADPNLTIEGVNGPLVSTGGLRFEASLG